MGRFDGQHFAILGAGRSGLAAARLAAQHGARATVIDEGDPTKLAAAVSKVRAAGFPTVIGQDATELIVAPGDFHLVIISPGLDANWPLPKKFTDAGVPLTGEMEFGFTLCTTPLIGITGTNGKSTCTELIAALFNGAGRPSIPCGNHGKALSEVIVEGEKFDTLSCEVSSFQLETIDTFRPKVSIWLNFAPDHLDRYPDLESYYKAKLRIFENQTADDWAIVRAGENIGDIAARRVTFSSETSDADFVYAAGKFQHRDIEFGDASKVKLRGRHNMENILAAVAAGWLLGLDFANMMDTLASYEAPRHRCELVRVFNDREYINDSKATNLHALESCIRSQDRPIVLIAGGKEKGLDYTPLRETIAGRVHAMALIGEIAPALEKQFSDLIPCRRATDMADAVRAATEFSRAGDAIILSPGTSSFDMYTGYAQRGDAFRDAVLALS